MQPINLRCEYLVNPRGIDILQPRLSWAYQITKETAQNEKQSAYQIFVAIDPDDLQQNIGSIWDSGKVDSTQSIQIEYAGPPLESNVTYYWKVKVWDDQGNVLDSSDSVKESYWHTGMLDSSAWHAQWIGTPNEEFQSVEVIDTTKDRPVQVQRTPPSPYLRKSFNCSQEIKTATLYASALGEYEVFLNGQRVGDRYFTPEWTDYAKRVQYQVYDVTPLIQMGSNVIGSVLSDGWYMGFLGPGDCICQLYYGSHRRFFGQLILQYNDGTIEEICTDNSWKVNDNGPIRWADQLSR